MQFSKTIDLGRLRRGQVFLSAVGVCQIVKEGQAFDSVKDFILSVLVKLIKGIEYVGRPRDNGIFFHD